MSTRWSASRTSRSTRCVATSSADSARRRGTARVAPHVRRLIEYRQLNFLEATDLNERFDVIFCRNVMIYFDRDVQQRVVSLLERHLAPGGYLFISHSESLNGTTHGLRWVAPAVYQRSGA